MPALTPEFLFDLESNMRLIAEMDYNRLLNNLWWQLVAKEMTSTAKRERINWLLDTARIRRTLAGGGDVTFEDILSRTTEYVNENASAGLELKKEVMEDHDQNGVQLATHWARQMGAYAAYWPQKQVADAIKEGGTGITYDGLPFFSDVSAQHLVNPFNTGGKSFANDFTGASAGGGQGPPYPGAVPISGVTFDVAVNNLQEVITYVAGISMPNSVDPRMLKVNKILVPPALTAVAQQLTQAQFIAQAAASGGGSGDISAVIRNWGFGEPVECPELAAAFGGNDTTYYVVAEEITSNELGALVYVNREPFQMIMHGEMTDAELARKRLLQWTTEGRNVVGFGHPYLLFRCQAT